TSLVAVLLQIQRTGIVRHRRETRRDLNVAQARFVAQLLFDPASDRDTRARQLARRARFALVHDTSGLSERQLLHVVAAEAEPVAGRQGRDRTAERLLYERDVARSIRIRVLGARGNVSVGQRFHPALDAHAIDVALREDGAQPRGQTAATLVIPQQRLPFAAAALHAVQIGIQRVGDLARALRAIERVGGAIEKRPVLANEPLPRVLVAVGTQPCELEIRGIGAHGFSRPPSLLLYHFFQSLSHHAGSARTGTSGPIFLLMSARFQPVRRASCSASR